jgi:hypothetical protein
LRAHARHLGIALYSLLLFVRYGVPREYTVDNIFLFVLKSE